MLLWAGFQVICVPVILLEGRMWMVTVAYCGYILVLPAAATVRYFRQSRTLRAVREAKPEKAEIILWVLAGVLLLVQPVLAVLMVYGDGDDAYYVAISAAAEESGRMYQKIPLYGNAYGTGCETRAGTFSHLDRMVAQMTGITTVIVAKTLVPVALISMTYGVFYLLGSRVLFAGEGAYRKKWALPAFLLCTEVLGAFRRLFLLYCREFYDCQEQTGEGCIGKYPDPHDIFPAADTASKNTGRTEDHCQFLGAVGICDDGLLSGQYHGSIAWHACRWERPGSVVRSVTENGNSYCH